MGKWMLAVLLVVAGLATWGQAANIALVNPSFEAPQVGGWVDVTTMPGWTIVGTQVSLVPASPTDGAQKLYLGNAYISQTLAGIGNPNQTYQLSVDATVGAVDFALQIYCGNEYAGQWFTTIPGQWMTGTMEWTAPANLPAGSDLTIRVATEDGGCIYIDNVRMTSVPEPASLILCMSGLIGIIGFKKKK